MNFIWLKNYLPRSLYGRAALILILPIVTIQLVVSVVFIQRLYEDVTQQMTRNVLFELRYILDEVDASASMDDAQRTLSMTAEPLAIEAGFFQEFPTDDSRFAYDLSGKVIIQTLREGLQGVLGIDLVSQDKMVSFGIETDHGPLVLEFPRRRVSAKNPHQLLVLMIATGILMTAIAYLFLRNQLRPIRRLAQASEAFGMGQHKAYHPSGATEVRAAGRSFLEMRARIERQIEQRTLMLSGVSHDLRTPITRLRLGMSMLGDTQEIEALRQDIDEMETLLDGFLNFVRGDALDELEESAPISLARQSVEQAQRAGKDVSIGKIVGQDTAIAIRPTAVSRALDNLVGNAVRYGDKAVVSVIRTSRSVRYIVEDDGPGIPEEQYKEALKPFARLEPSRNQNYGSGVGLGLSIAADIARGHGGELRLGQSETLGGLKIELRLAC